MDRDKDRTTIGDDFVRIPGLVEKKTDLEIVNLLQKNGRLSFKEIAEELDASIGSVSNRVNDLIEHDKVSFVCWYDPWKSGMEIYAEIKIAVRPAKKFSNVVEALKDIEEVSFLAGISGEFDLETNVICKSLSHLNDLLDNEISILDGVYETNTVLYKKLLKYEHPAMRALFSSS